MPPGHKGKKCFEHFFPRSLLVNHFAFAFAFAFVGAFIEVLCLPRLVA